VKLLLDEMKTRPVPPIEHPKYPVKVRK